MRMAGRGCPEMVCNHDERGDLPARRAKDGRIGDHVTVGFATSSGRLRRATAVAVTIMADLMAGRYLYPLYENGWPADSFAPTQQPAA
ncbi:hypothetical protein B0O95_11932 [Mycetohabitans endofungorum]|uniref:Uncharacterized protein n=1 Tax=Mycetohabitans endofungorum TaxID=417203 RepID=A0A2P5K754_9BURK|nr:hypothetical protein B0O95_11932 [Mycetohabitans endofungorum]